MESLVPPLLPGKSRSFPSLPFPSLPFPSLPTPEPSQAYLYDFSRNEEKKPQLDIASITSGAINKALPSERADTSLQAVPAYIQAASPDRS